MDISQTIHLLGDLLGQVISELESPHVFEVEEKIRALAKARRNGDASSAASLQQEVSSLNTEEARAVAASFAAYFDLVNRAEENQRIQILRRYEDEKFPEPIHESIGEAIATLKQRGITRGQMEDLLGNLSIELVLTAHPTEARRRTVLSKMERITELITQIGAGSLSLREQEDAIQLLRNEISFLWLTDRARAAKLSVADEVKTGLYFVDSFFWNTIPVIYDDLEKALERHYPGLHAPADWFKLASWIGGDRDGNPNVTSDVTAETLRLHRGLAVENHRKSFHELARHLSVSSNRIPPPQALMDWIEKRRPFPPHIAYIEKRYVTEPYRLVLSLLASDLAEASREDMKSHLLQSYAYHARMEVKDLAQPLELIATAIPQKLTQDDLQDVRRKLMIFGLHAARLDIREDSSRLNAALSEILRALNLESDFENLPADSKTELLARLIKESAPQLSNHPGVTSATAETWSLFQLIGRTHEVYGSELLGPIVISMTHAASDVLSVLLLAKWAGCKTIPQIAPLFESVPDLKDAPRILGSLFTSEIYREHLTAHNNEQMVMIGYSDSNKDGGYLMANWSLYEAQEEITRVAQKHNIKLTIFHGRGGTIARGGGPANSAIRAQPAGSINGRFRLTEQGEIIALRYSNPGLAHRHLEQIASAVILASAPLPHQPISKNWRSAMSQMSDAAQRAYRKMVYETPGFIEFWQSATPLDQIKHLQIGSRPSARSQTGAVNQIRAIPWVFSWMQSRFNLPGWYGLGSGLAVIDDKSLLQEMYASWPFFKTLLANTEMSLLKADMDISALYVDLVSDKKLANEIFSSIRSEYERTREAVLSISGHSTLLELEPATRQAVQVRNPYVDPLNYIQVETLRRLRSLPDQESPEALALREVMAITINGIASGLRNTG
ncbi:phosphoenolpyruvate carboxylase [Candidatus Villigracilis affinis]|uniref:phosphoenolpyruvate carboxylase n=1 Tax=Candidatus Villigracilis affinis TaxID=3140682 RepID=UPI002A1F2A7C|nr:phosphoenolpyruvate carboxylase [Anaerolineales bacterium]